MASYQLEVDGDEGEAIYLTVGTSGAMISSGGGGHLEIDQQIGDLDELLLETGQEPIKDLSLDQMVVAAKAAHLTVDVPEIYQSLIEYIATYRGNNP